MGKERNGSVPEKGENGEEERKFKGKARENSGLESESKEDRKRRKSKRKARENSESDSESETETEAEEERKRSRKSEKRKSKYDRKSRRRHSSEDEDSDSQSDYSSDSESEYSDSEERESESEEERRRRKRKERKRRDREDERERKRRRREKEKNKSTRRRREKEDERERKRKRKEKKRKKKKERLERGEKGAVTNSWGKYGIIRETDMWNKRPEFTAWLAEVKQVNLESLPTWEEKLMFKQFMEDHNTATFPSKKYYNLDAYYKHEMEKEMKKGFKKASQTERTVFNDEEQRRLELQQAREKQKEEEVEALKRSMQSGMAQAMREQAQLREEMAYQYKLGNFEAAAAIQRRLDPDVAI